MVPQKTYLIDDNIPNEKKNEQSKANDARPDQNA